jgi:hypothetical protein
MIEFSELSKSYGAFRALARLTLTVPRGEMFDCHRDAAEVKRHVGYLPDSPAARFGCCLPSQDPLRAFLAKKPGYGPF